jgi:hypothetical protein
VNHLIMASVVVCTACNAASREQPQSQSRRNLDAEVTALQLSQMCSTGAESFWRRNGYDHPSAPAKGTTENWGYQSHYSAEHKRCFVLVESVMQFSTGASSQHQEVFDAIEGGEPTATLNIFKLTVDAAPRVTLLKTNTAIPTSTENLDWFRGLMSK